jgi:hypothetical protein
MKYHEVSGRQTGKTTRLIKDMTEVIIQNIHNVDFSIGLLTPNGRNTELILEKVKTNILSTLNNTQVHSLITPIHILVDRCVTKIFRNGCRSVDMLYIDEYDFICIREYASAVGSLKPTGDRYICTTPNGSNFSGFRGNDTSDIISYDISRKMRLENYQNPDVETWDTYCTTQGVIPLSHPFEVYQIVTKGLKRHRFI